MGSSWHANLPTEPGLAAAAALPGCWTGLLIGFPSLFSKCNNWVWVLSRCVLLLLGTLLWFSEEAEGVRCPGPLKCQPQPIVLPSCKSVTDKIVSVCVCDPSCVSLWAGWIFNARERKGLSAGEYKRNVEVLWRWHPGDSYMGKARHSLGVHLYFIYLFIWPGAGLIVWLQLL